MAKKKTSIPNGFDDILNNIYTNSEKTGDVTNIDDIVTTTSFVEEDTTKEPPVKEPEDGKVDDTITKVNDDDSQIPEDVLNKINNVENNTNPDQQVDNTADVDNEALIEAQQVSLLFDAVGESLGWNIADIDEEDRPLTVEDLTNYLTETVRQNSVPNYADERIQALDEYVKNGGKFEDFYDIQKSNLSLDSIDMEDESNQKAIVRELLKHDGYTEDQINRRINRYEDADVLYEESEDALERLKLIRKEEEANAAKEQELFARQQQEQQRAFYESVTKDINSLTNIRGIAIPKEDRKALFDYIFKVDQSGMSQYQKDFNENLSKNLIESAYFTMKADTLISNAKKDGESSAAQKLRKMLRHTAKNHTAYNADQEKQKSVIDLASGLF